MPSTRTASTTANPTGRCVSQACHIWKDSLGHQRGSRSREGRLAGSLPSPSGAVRSAVAVTCGVLVLVVRAAAAALEARGQLPLRWEQEEEEEQQQLVLSVI